jgi:hypothetical protein
MAKTDPGADDIVKEAIDAFELAQDAESENRNHAKEDLLFARMGEQWDDKILQERRTAGRPCLTINKMQAVIRQVVNDSRQNRPATKVHPCDSNADPETAEILSGIIRSIEANSDADVAYDTAVDAAVSGGFGYWQINTDYALNALDSQSLKSAGASAFEQDIFIRRVANPFCVYGDPYSTAADSSDWMQAHVIDCLTSDQFKAKYKGATETDFDGHLWTNVSAPWRDGDDVQIAAYWKRERIIKNALMVQMADSEAGPGDIIALFEDDEELKGILAAGATVIGRPRPVSTFNVCQYIVNGVEQLEKNEWAGAYIPIIPVYGDEVNIEGKRHFRSLIRDAKDDQRMFNYWNTTATEIVALAPRVPYLMEEDAIPKGWANKWATSNSQSHPYLLYKKGSQLPQRQPGAGIPTGVMEMIAQSSDNIKAITGIYDASLGARSNETSGRAILARQREGDVSTFHFIDNLTRAIRHSGRILVDLIPKVYSTERIVRILGEDGSPDTVKVNGEFEDAKGVMRMHDIRTGRYDVTVTSGPSFTTRREEAAEQMMNLIQSYPDAAPVIGDLLAKNLDWPGADEIAKRLEKMLPPEIRGDDGQIPPAVQQRMQQMGQALNALHSQLQEAMDKKDIDRAKIAVETYKAETERMQALTPAMPPEGIALIVRQTLAEIAGQVLPDAEVAPAGPGAFAQPAMGQAA